MQYEKHHDGSLTPLKQKNVDTGWGLERNLAFLNGFDDVYKIDVHVPAITAIEEASGIKYDSDEKLTRSMRILADHTRTAVMLIGDEAKLLPSNAGAGYVLRRLIRRAVRHARTLGLKKENILKVAETYISVYSESYPNVLKNKEFILTELGKEIERFEATLENGLKEFKKILETKQVEKSTDIDGKEAFYLYDTFGFPLELTIELAEEEGLKVDESGFAAAMEEQKQKAREGKNFSQKLTGQSVFDNLDESLKTEFLGYDALGCDGTVVAMVGDEKIVNELKAGDEGTMITDRTTFYGTMGGQVGDIGEILGQDGSKFEVTEAIHVAGGRTAHVGKVVSGSIKTGSKVSLNVNKENRAKTCRNHSATHLLQAALRQVLGNDAHQAGSFQDPDRTRFDFSYGQAMTKEQLEKVERIVNEKIEAGLPVSTDVMSIDEAKKTGAMALFGEKYGDSVRVVSMGDFSKELCGGTHVKNTGDIASFKILSESGVAAGVRRIEAITGSNVLAYYKNLEETLNQAAAAAKTQPALLAEKIIKLQADNKALSSELESLKAKMAKDSLGSVLDSVVEVKGVKVLAAKVPGVDMNGLRDLSDNLCEKMGGGIAVLISEADGKVNLVAKATDDAIAKGAHAGNLIKAIAPIVGGGGGGRPNMAQAGGKNPAGIEECIKAVAGAVEAQIK